MIRLFLSLLAVLISPMAWAQVVEDSYDRLARELDGRITFDALPQRSEPGFNLDAPIRVRGAWLGERFSGQRVQGAPHDRLQGAPLAMSVQAGAPGASLSVAFHRGFQSNALFPLGPLGFPAIAARGEGALALRFDRDQAALGLRVHSDYPDSLGTGAPRGGVILTLYRRDGSVIAVHEMRLDPGITNIGLRRVGGIPDIAGFTLTNTDPGGIAIDDILFRLTAFLG